MEDAALSASKSVLKYYHSMRVGKYNIRYVKVGHGPRALFVFPGLMGGMKTSFQHLIPEFERDGLSKYTLYGWDTPGYTEFRDPFRSLDDVSFAVDVELARELLEKLGHSKYDILGSSAGSQRAILFVLKYPHLVNRLAIWGVIDRMNEQDVINNRKMRDPYILAGPVLLNLLEQFDGMKDDYMKHHQAWYDWLLQEYAGKDQLSWEKKFDGFTFPTLIVHGELDTVSRRETAENLHRLMINSRLHILKRCPHAAHYFMPKELYAVLDSFLMEPTAEDEGGITADLAALEIK